MARDIRAETRCASGVWQRLMLAAVLRAACRSRGARETGSDRILRARGDEEEDEGGEGGSRRRRDLNGGEDE
jgi:hypothetical protein